MRFICLMVCLSIFAAWTFPQNRSSFTIEGHRGARGYSPENTIPSFILAIDQGADTLELDVVVTRDNKLLVSHEPWFSSVISLDPNGQRIPKEKEREHNIFKMTYSETTRYDVGRIGNAGFPEQRPVKIAKPLLTDVFKSVEKYTSSKKLPVVRYNIEIKSHSQGDDSFHPVPSVFAKLLLEDVSKFKLQDRVIIQSFDVRPLQEIKRTNGNIPLALLVNNPEGVGANLAKLGFIPDTYSPHFSLVDAALVKYCRENGMKIVPWTVNDVPDLERMRTFDLDGIITDYPDRAVKVFRK